MRRRRRLRNNDFDLAEWLGNRTELEWIIPVLLGIVVLGALFDVLRRGSRANPLWLAALAAVLAVGAMFENAS